MPKATPKKERAAPPKGKAGPAAELRHAAKEGDLRQVRALATAHMVDDKDERGFSALTWACWTGNEAIAEVLLERGAATDVADDDGQTPLFHACWYGHANIALLLLQAGADPDIADSDGESPLSAAARGGEYLAVRHLIEANANPRTRDGEGHNAVSRALQRNHTHIAHLIEDYAKVYVRGETGPGDAVRKLIAISDQQQPVPLGPAAHLHSVSAGGGGMGSPDFGGAAGFGGGVGGGGGFLSGPQSPLGSPSSRTPLQAVAALDGLQLRLQERLRVHNAPLGQPPGGGAPGTGVIGGGYGAEQRLCFDSLTVLGGDTVRLTARGCLPPMGTFARLQGSNAYWRVLQLTKGGGVKLQSVAAPDATSCWGEAGDEMGPGVWAALPAEQQQQLQQHLQQHLAQQRQQMVTEQQRAAAHAAHPTQQAHAGYGAADAGRYAGAGGIAFGAASAKIAAMPLSGLPPPGSPRPARYKKDHPCARGKNECTVCGEQRPPLNFCEDCNEELCGACWVGEHQNRKRRKHVPHPVDVEE